MFRDITRKTRTLVRWLVAHCAALVATALAEAYAIAYPAILDLDVGPVEWVSLSSTLTLLVAGVLTLRWIYAANANAQRLADDMTVSPGWNVVWFFVPVANLWKPFQGVRETWAVSHQPEAWRTVRIPGLLRFWWAVWLVASLLGDVSAWAGWRADTPDALLQSIVVDLAAVAASFVVTLALIGVTRNLSRAQARTIMRHTFA